jgi:hypothetical protein
MTNAQLIARLQKMPPDAKVVWNGPNPPEVNAATMVKGEIVLSYWDKPVMQ